MAVPKSRTSKARRDQRRAHHALRPGAQANCPQCGEPRLPHRVCKSCGHYRDRTVLEVEEED